MDEFVATLVGCWVIFASIFSAYVVTSDNVTTKNEIIRLCNEVGQFQHDVTIVECKIKSKE